MEVISHRKNCCDIEDVQEKGQESTKLHKAKEGEEVWQLGGEGKIDEKSK